MPYADRAVQRAYQNRWMKHRRATWLAVNGPCVDCKSEADLQVDHQDFKLKVSHRIWSWTDARRTVELAKCVVRCAPCHKRKTMNEGSLRHGGEKNCHAKLTATDVIEIRARRGAGELMPSIARSFNVHPVTILRIVRGQRWKHIPLTSELT